jgi:hypothetical protein
VSALFDEMVLLDHAPVDGTRESVEALSQRDRLVRLYDFIAPAYELNGAVSFQSPASSLQRRKISDLADSFADQRLTVGCGIERRKAVPRQGLKLAAGGWQLFIG